MLWGHTGADVKALFAFHLNEEDKEVLIYAYPQEEVSENLQNSLFAWKNGASFDFSSCKMTWKIDAQSESILPKDIRVDKPEFIQRTQMEWGKILMSSRMYVGAKEEVVLHKMLVSSSKEFKQEYWEKTKELWEKYSQMLKEREITWEHAQLLKAEIDEIFEVMKSQKEKKAKLEKSKIKEIVSGFERELEQLKAQTIYSEEWPGIYENLKRIQEEIKQSPIKFHLKKPLFQKVDEVYHTLRTYRETQSVGHVKSRLENLNRILKNTTRAINKDKESLEMQKEKLAHYMRGQKPEAGPWSKLLKPLEEKIEANEKKAEDIRKTIEQLNQKLKETESKAESSEEIKEETETESADTKS